MTAMSTPEVNYVEDLSADAKTVLSMFGQLVVDDTLGNGAPGYLAAIDQAGLNANAAFAAAGLNTTNLADAQYALSAIKTAINNALPALAILAKAT